MKKIIIIGAGIAGLTSGIYARLNGFESEIFEMHSKPGGECTGWQRGDFHFDNCIHWLVGSKKGTPMYKLWETIGALNDSVDIINNDKFVSYYSGNQMVHIYKDLDKLEKHLLEIAPEDKVMIKEFCRDAKKVIKLEMPVEKPFDLFTKKDMFAMIYKMLPLIKTMQKYEKISMQELIEKFKNPELKVALRAMIPSNYKAIALLSTLASMHTNDSGWPAGGSLALAKRVADRFLGFGGKINYKSRVEEIIINDGVAKGVKLSDGSIHLADYVIAAADGHEVIYDLLGGKYIDDTINTLFTDNETYPIYSSVYISMGIEANLSNYPDTLYFKLKNPIDAGGIKHDYIGAKHYCYEPTFAPKNNSVLIALLTADYDWWVQKKENPAEYKAEKERIGNEVASALKEEFQEIKDNIKVIDVATPMTYERYCNAYRGAWMSYATTPNAKIRFITGVLPGLDNFYMTGQWLMPPGGLPTAVMTGKWTIQRMCKKENMEFKYQ
jgi:phytoene desaturase